MRRLEYFAPKKERENPLFHIYQTVSFWRTLKNTLIIEFCRFFPFMAGKNWLYRKCLGMEIGAKTAFAFKVTPDLLFPEKIHVGENSVIGYHTTILTHEYLPHEYRVGEVMIGREVLIGANVTILAGVSIGDGAVVAAGSVVSRDVPAGAFAFGNPLQIKESK
ncbi:acyltransferase [Listeria ilorinensis]|uniref:acyltransferase n=1 Tax=Listeria ilorinensis TaxID=2867439 RepID=UPI001EF449DF|nr:acyltransferase [Listeria ilorinensis]